MASLVTLSARDKSRNIYIFFLSFWTGAGPWWAVIPCYHCCCRCIPHLPIFLRARPRYSAQHITHENIFTFNYCFGRLLLEGASCFARLLLLGPPRLLRRMTPPQTGSPGSASDPRDLRSLSVRTGRLSNNEVIIMSKKSGQKTTFK